MALPPAATSGLVARGGAGMGTRGSFLREFSRTQAHPHCTGGSQAEGAQLGEDARPSVPKRRFHLAQPRCSASSCESGSQALRAPLQLCAAEMVCSELESEQPLQRPIPARGASIPGICPALTPWLPTVAIYTVLQQGPGFLCRTQGREQSEATGKHAWLLLPFGIRAPPTARDGGTGLLRWLRLKSKGCTASNHPANPQLGADSRTRRSDAQQH